MIHSLLFLAPFFLAILAFRAFCFLGFFLPFVPSNNTLDVLKIPGFDYFYRKNGSRLIGMLHGEQKRRDGQTRKPYKME